MMHYPKRGEKAYEFSVYNREVRQLVKSNRHHSLYGDEWADNHHQSICADCEAEARKRITEKFPKERGFVIEAVHETAVQ